MEILTGVAAVATAVVASWMTATKLVGAARLRELVGQLLDQRSRYKQPVLVAATTEGAALELAQALGDRGFTNVKVLQHDDPQVIDPKPGTVVVFGARPNADLAARVFGEGGVIFVEGRAVAPKGGEWSFANSRVTLHARLLEYVEYVRAGEAA